MKDDNGSDLSYVDLLKRFKHVKHAGLNDVHGQSSGLGVVSPLGER